MYTMAENQGESYLEFKKDVPNAEFQKYRKCVVVDAELYFLSREILSPALIV